MNSEEFLSRAINIVALSQDYQEFVKDKSMLKTEQNTEQVEKSVRKAAIKKFGKRIFGNRMQGQIFYEHGQWWLQHFDQDDEIISYSVVDAEPGILDTGLDFEEC